VDENLLVLLHGLGDSDAGFVRFGEAMRLPQTALLALRAPLAVPLLGGGMWFDTFDAASCERVTGRERGPRADDLLARRLATLHRCADAVAAGLTALQASHGVPLSKMHLLGLGDGAAVALAVAQRVAVRSVAALCGCLLPEQRPAATGPGKGTGGAPTDGRDATGEGARRAADEPAAHTGDAAVRAAAQAAVERAVPGAGPAADVPGPPPSTDVLLLHSAADEAYTPEDVVASERLLCRGDAAPGGGGMRVHRVCWQHRGPGTPASPAEMRPLMEHLAAALSRRLVALEDDASVVELGAAAGRAVGRG
jgi:predicted esterase